MLVIITHDDTGNEEYSFSEDEVSKIINEYTKYIEKLAEEVK